MFLLQNDFIANAFSPISEETKSFDLAQIWIILGISVAVFLLFLVLGSIAYDMLFLRFLLAIPVFISGIVLIFSIFVLTFLASENGKTYTVNNVESTQEWVKDTYLIELNEKQANKLINNRMDLLENSNSQTTLVKYYGKDVLVQLVQVDKTEWALFLNGEKLPEAEGQ